MERDKRCIICGDPSVQGTKCLKHLIIARERQRKKHGMKRRFFGTLSYKLQEAATQAIGKTTVKVKVKKG
jgi:hypothetical protein